MKETVPRTLGIAVAVALVCSALVAGAVHLLRPIQAAYQQVDRNRAILDAAGRLPATADDAAVVASFLDLDVRLADLATGTLAGRTPITDLHGYDHWSVDRAAPAALIRGSGDAGEVSVPPGPARYVPVYPVWRDGRLERLVLPVHGQGMWSTIRAYLALESDLETVAALRIYDHGETPGIGDRIEDPQWLARWSGKQAIDASGAVLLEVVRQPSAPSSQVHLITGASVTSQALGRLVHDWLGERGYGTLLARIRRGEIVLEAP